MSDDLDKAAREMAPKTRGWRQAMEEREQREQQRQKEETNEDD